MSEGTHSNWAIYLKVKKNSFLLQPVCYPPPPPPPPQLEVQPSVAQLHAMAWHGLGPQWNSAIVWTGTLIMVALFKMSPFAIIPQTSDTKKLHHIPHCRKLLHFFSLILLLGDRIGVKVMMVPVRYFTLNCCCAKLSGTFPRFFFSYASSSFTQQKEHRQ